MNVGRSRTARSLELAGWLTWSVACGSSPPIADAPTVVPTETPAVASAGGLLDRNLRFNGIMLGPAHAEQLGILESNRGALLPGGAYWYDSRSGALGEWGGPTLEFVTAGLSLGASLPADASASTTNVFLNGREVHALDLARIEALIGRSVPLGRYWMDANGDAGPEGGGALINVFQEVARQHREQPGRAPPPIPGSLR